VGCFVYLGSNVQQSSPEVETEHGSCTGKRRMWCCGHHRSGSLCVKTLLSTQCSDNWRPRNAQLERRLHTKHYMISNKQSNMSWTPDKCYRQESGNAPFLLSSKHPWNLFIKFIITGQPIRRMGDTVPQTTQIEWTALYRRSAGLMTANPTLLHTTIIHPQLITTNNNNNNNRMSKAMAAYRTWQ